MLTLRCKTALTIYNDITDDGVEVLRCNGSAKCPKKRNKYTLTKGCFETVEKKEEV